MNTTITAIDGILVGHATDEKAVTGCTVMLCPKGTVGGVDQRGGAPGTRETDLLRPMHLVQNVHGIVLSGGSAFGLDAASGVMKYLEERNIGFNTGIARVPIVPAAVIYDLGIGNSKVRPDAKMGYEACVDASGAEVAEGNIGAGMGACVGGLYGPKYQMKGGVGCVCIDLGGGLKVGALMVVNCFGDVLELEKIIAGTRKPLQGKTLADTQLSLKSFAGKAVLKFAGRNTVIGVVATNAKLTKEEANKVAAMAQDGIARSIRPAHTMLDGDTIFSLATGKKQGDVNLIGAYAAEAVSQAIISGVKAAKTIEGRISYSEVNK
jgi:L-aminopeptidase/D-esterase-like protein